jgi:hypothetical protein
MLPVSPTGWNGPCSLGRFTVVVGLGVSVGADVGVFVGAVVEVTVGGRVGVSVGVELGTRVASSEAVWLGKTVLAAGAADSLQPVVISNTAAIIIYG